MTGYVVITPVRDEVKHIEHTISSMLAQTLPPTEWVLVDDGSTDGTAEVVDRYRASVAWLSVVQRPNRGFRAAGGGVVEAFYAGYRALRSSDWEFLVKLDGDLSFSSSYFQECLERFEQDPELGIGGGVIESVSPTGLVRESHPTFHVRGATKIYRRSCWNDIDGLVKAPGWDTLDEVKATMLGWKTRSFEDLTLTQLKPTGSAAGQWRNWVKNGEASYISGYHPLFVIVRSAGRLRQRPYVVASIGLLWGFTRAWFRRLQRVDDKELVTYVRQQQLRRIFGKESVWR